MNETLKQQLTQSGYAGDFDLSSLIRFFGKEQFGLSQIPEAFAGWKAVTKDGELRAKGDTPEIAVANLILIAKTPTETKDIPQI